MCSKNENENDIERNGTEWTKWRRNVMVCSCCCCCRIFWTDSTLTWLCKDWTQKSIANINVKSDSRRFSCSALLGCFFFCHIYNGMDQQKWWNRMCAFAIYRTVYEETTHTNTPRSYEQCLRHILKRKNRASDSLLQYCYINDVYYVLGLNESNTRNIRNELTTIHDRIYGKSMQR